MFASLLNMLDKQTVGEVAHALGQSEQPVSRGMESSITALLAGVASKSEDISVLGRILDTASGKGGNISWSHIAAEVAHPGSSLMTAGKRLVAGLFGGREQAVTREISRESGLSPGAASTLLAMAAPVVMSYLSNQIREGKMTMRSLGGLLQREIPAIRSTLPSGLSELFWPGAAAASTVSPVVAQVVQKERSLGWLAALGIATLGLGGLWFVTHARRLSIEPVTPVASGTADRVATPVPEVVCALPTNVNMPEGGVEARLLAFVQNPGAKPDATTWFNLDQLVFDTGSATLRPESKRQLNNIAALLTSCPTVAVTIAGYTDNVGSAEPNLRLSRNRAERVVAQLVSKGVSANRLTAEGYGEDYPIADNSSEEGRAHNRHVAMRITQK
jgi:outer membrane protein OmpA-like peptidoglycan-associated protein